MPKIQKEKKTPVMPITIEGIFYPDPVFEKPGKEIYKGKVLKGVLENNDLIASIPIALSNEKIVDYMEFNPHTVRIPNKGELRSYGGIAGFQGLSGRSSVVLSLERMNFRPLYIQIEVSEFRATLDPGYTVETYEGVSHYFLSQKRTGYPIKHTMIKAITQNDIHSSVRFITISRIIDNWNLHKIKVYVLETSL